MAFGETMTRLSTLPLDAYSRLRYYLISLARETDGCVVVQGLWMQQQLAGLAGCCRATVGRILCELARGGWIRFEKQRISILQPLPEQFLYAARFFAVPMRYASQLRHRTGFTIPIDAGQHAQTRIPVDRC